METKSTGALFPLASPGALEPAHIETVPIVDELPRYFGSLTGLRFWAALLVVLYHMTSYIGHVPIASDMAMFGRTGVTFFFILSGFVLSWTYMGRETPFIVFCWRRLVRIWPLHILATLLSIAAYVGTNDKIANEFSLKILAPAIFLVHAWFPQSAIVRGGSGASWSLSDEMFFYLAFPILLIMFSSINQWHRLLWVPIIMTGMSLVMWLAIPMEGIGMYYRAQLLDYFPLTRMVQFISGVAIAVAIRRGWRSSVSVPAAILVIIAYHAALIPWAHAFDRADKWYPYSASQLFSLIPFALLIAAVATNDLRGRPSHLSTRAFVLLGQASFAWYLVHSPGILVYLYFFGKPESLQLVILGWVVVAIVTQLVSIGVFLRFERPLVRALRGRINWKGGPVLAPS